MIEPTQREAIKSESVFETSNQDIIQNTPIPKQEISQEDIFGDSYSQQTQKPITRVYKEELSTVPTPQGTLQTNVKVSIMAKNKAAFNRALKRIGELTSHLKINFTQIFQNNEKTKHDYKR